MWLVTDSDIKSFDKPWRKSSLGKFTLYYQSPEADSFLDIKQETLIFWSGNPQLRMKIDEVTDIYQQISTLFLHGGEIEVSEALTGNYVLGIISKQRVCLISDRFAIKKFFYCYGERGFVASNSLKEVLRIYRHPISYEGIAKYVLGYHFIGGSTLISDVYHNQPAEILCFERNSIKHDKYWDPRQLLQLEPHSVSIKEIVNVIERSFVDRLRFNSSELVSLSLTGGGDTRNVLAILLKNNINLRTFTYGNPESNDCIRAKEIANGLKIDHAVHDFKMTRELFTSIAREIIRIGEGLASIHRAHRLLSIMEESKIANTLVLGTLGGEFIKGVDNDDYITPRFIYENFDRDLTSKTVDFWLREKCFQSTSIDIDSLTDFFKESNYFSGNTTERKISVLSEITAHLHDAQDINIFQVYMKNVITPFLDIDYLELLFSSEFSFEKKERIKLEWRRKLEFPSFAVKFLSEVYPSLLNYQYAGGHKPDELLFNKYYGAAKRILRKRVNPKYPQNFPLSGWMKEFVLSELPKCYDYSALREVFDLNALIMQVDRVTKYETTEKYWLKFTNPIMMRYIIEEFGV